MSDAAVASEPKAARSARERLPEPVSVVVFGASGDLAKRKIYPALYALWRDKFLPDRFSVIGFARTPMEAEAFRAKILEGVMEFCRIQPLADGEWKPFAANLHYLSGEYQSPESYAKLGQLLKELETKDQRPAQRLFYLSTPPNVYQDIIRQLGSAGLSRPAEPKRDFARIIIEKPFGTDLDSARALNATLHESFDETQVYRIDHFLGKETVQNILVLRFANGIFEPIWNRSYVDHVQITAAEKIGIEGRAGYYEQAGVMRDMFQNHMMQLLTLVAMEPPVSFDAEHVRDEKVKVMHAIHPIAPAEVNQVAVRGQYGKGRLGSAEAPGYRDEPGVDKKSVTETFAAVRFMVDNWRWADVPFYLRSGKRMPERVTEIAIQFKRAPHMLFKNLTDPIKPNVLVLRIQPDEGITLSFEAKLPGATLRTQPVNMEFKYRTAFGVGAPEAYERLLLDCLLGDATLFDRADSVEKAWSLVMPLLENWSATAPPWFPNYSAGSWGPPEAYALIERDGRWWRKPVMKSAAP